MNPSPLKPYIVLVDDDTDYLVAANELINEKLPGYTVFMCPGPIEAIYTMHKLDGPAVFMVDFDMPDMDGLTLIKHNIRKTFRFDSFCYLVSGHADHRVLAEAIRNDVLYFSKSSADSSKPLNLGELYQSHIEYAVKQLREIDVDPLTELPTKKEFNSSYRRDFAHAKRDMKPLSFILVDVNFLKVVNETFGYLAGDTLLREIGLVLKKSLRNNFDSCVRLGGDEFGILLPETTWSNAEVVAKRLVHDIGDLEIGIAKKTYHPSVAVGISMMFPRRAGNDAEVAFKSLFLRAEKAMKRNKKEMKAAEERRFMEELGVSRDLIREIEARGGLAARLAHSP